ncbi:phosphatidylglycerol/phosphatidylinositol transfer protein [Anaeramoeba flamelloides]|uniref:Phosphatidylglycerol/phosphatidylinositol transfer protein n=1 Tax=Anaeramoeba flamelloides TaxID=1746091 RepID=A0AAV8A7G1_9EUKA|nr:phosphatidylglycerol/phosphatidylinositol transfer protein [Anaeramoeba flamelloides]|eukprot:Anaeramoba_flamelloidesa86014_17585.p1 GENE.a86014_17585~~a86014_17585.p1  ORF type:complete len:160 (-),score=24.20 a86014_17585:258-686(-)
MLKLLIVLLLVSTIYCKSWELCSSSEKDILTVKTVSIVPEPIQKGKNVTITFDGTLSEAIKDPANIHLEVYMSGIKIFTKDMDMCTAQNDVPCPISAGEHKLSQSFEVPAFVPTGEFTGKIVATNYDKKEVICIKFDEKIQG